MEDAASQLTGFDSSHSLSWDVMRGMTILGNLLILLFNTYMMEKVPNVLKKQKIFFLADK